MSTNKTQNYQLNQWVKSDQVKMEDFNADNAKIDAALKAHDTSLASKASAAALSSLQSVVNGKASASAVSSLQSTVSAHSASLAGKGNCQLYFATHTFSSEFGSNHPTTLTFPKKPLLVLVASSMVRLLMVQGVGGSWSESMASSEGGVSVSWSGNSVSWSSQYSAGQLAGRTCAVLALLQAD